MSSYLQEVHFLFTLKLQAATFVNPISYVPLVQIGLPQLSWMNKLNSELELSHL